MYIKRKVFSVIIDEYGEERLYSSDEYINEEDYLDEVLYSKKKKEEEEEDEDEDYEKYLKGAAIGTGIAGGTAGAVYGGKKLGRRIQKSEPLPKRISAWAYDKTGGRIGSKTKKRRIAEALQKPYDVIVPAGKKAGIWIKGHKKAAGLAGGGVALAGLGAAGVAAYKKRNKDKKD